MNSRLGPLLILLLTVTLLPALAQEDDGEPAWVTYQRGLRALEERDLGAALERFREALSKEEPFPEAEAGIGRVFMAEGNVRLSIRQFERALEHTESFYVAESEYAVRYELAELYRQQERWADYEETLASIAERNPQFSPDHDPELRRLVPEVLTRRRAEGRPREPRLDTILTLYRLDANFAYRAHLELGERLIDGGRYDEAVDHASFAAVAALSRLVEELRRRHYDYEFESVRQLLEDALEAERLQRYVEEAEVFRALLRLGAAVWGTDPSSNVPEEIWEVAAAFPDVGGEWAQRAARALERPETAAYVD
ncbi:MAG: tetratricopeptide repeat protein [Spirochaetota bacterium]